MDQKPTKEELEFYQAYSENKNKFLDHYGEWADTYSHLNIRSVALEVHHRPDILTRKKFWLNLFTSIDLSVHPIKECLELVEGQELLFSSRTLPADQLPQVLCDFDNSHLHLTEPIDGESKIIFSKAEKPLSCRRSGPLISEAGCEWPTVRLQSIGKAVFEIVGPERKEAIDSKLRQGSPTAYNNLEDLLTKKTGMTGNCTDMRIIAPIFLQFGEKPRPKMKNKVLTFSVVGHKVLRNLGVSLVLDGAEDTIPKPPSPITFDMDQGDALNHTFFRVTKTVDCGEATKATLHLYRGTTWVDSTWAEPLDLTRSNPRLTAHALFDEELTCLTEWYQGAKAKKERKGRKFEASIHMLLHICGFSTEWLGFMGGALDESELDVIAFASEPSRIILAVECSTSNWASKVTKLEERADMLEKALPDWQIIPLIFVQRDIQKLDKDILIVGTPQIEQILALARKGYGSENIIEYIESLKKGLKVRLRLK